ncbi:hypothetical protein ScPMuIL_012837 [Solemya velum]
MAEDREILREIWEGKIPVCFTLASEEVHSEQPDPIYLLVSRLSYFPVVTDKVYRHFSRCIDQEKLDEMWLEYEGLPIKWHYPIGLLFDLLAGDEVLPWSITVHFQNFPRDELLHCPNKEAVESLYMSTLKEADALKHRSQIVNSMQRKDHKQLWIGLQNDNFDQFWAVNRKLMEMGGDDMFRHIPFRIYQSEKPYLQKLFRPVSEEGYTQNLEQLLKMFVPHIWGKNGELLKRVLIHGVDPPLNTSILWLSEHFSYPDNFLHICIVPMDIPS